MKTIQSYIFEGTPKVPIQVSSKTLFKQIQNQQQPSFRTPPLFNQFQQATGSPISHKQLQHIVFEEIGEMAPQMMYVHVLIPLNITTLYQQAELYKTYLLQLSNSNTSVRNRIHL